MPFKVDPHSLVDKVGEKVTQKHLNKLLYAQLVHKVRYSDDYSPGKGVVKREIKTEYLVYFLYDGRVRWMDFETLLYHKKEVELAYVNFLINKRAEVSQDWNAATRIWTTGIDERLKNLFKLRKRGVPPFKLHYVGEDGQDKEVEIKILEISQDKWGSYVYYQAMEGTFDTVSISNLDYFKYRPDKLRALHYQIM